MISGFDLYWSVFFICAAIYGASGNLVGSLSFLALSCVVRLAEIFVREARK